MTNNPEDDKLLTDVNFVADRVISKDGTPVEEPSQDVLDAVNQRMTEIIIDYERDHLRNTYIVPERDFSQALGRIMRGDHVDPNPTIFTVTGRSASRKPNPIYMYERQYAKSYIPFPSPLDDTFFGPWGQWRKRELQERLRKTFAALKYKKRRRFGVVREKVRDWLRENYAVADFVTVVGSVVFLLAAAASNNIPLLALGFAFLALAICNPWLNDKW